MKTKYLHFRKTSLMLGILLCSLASIGATTINLKFLIQGYYISNSYYTSSPDKMVAARMNQGCPAPNANNVVTTVTVGLISITNPTIIIDPTPATLNTDGTCVVTFAANYTGMYRINIAGCNMGSNCSLPFITLGTTPAYFDFTQTPPGYTHNYNEVEVEPGVWAFVSGDVNQDGNLELLDVALMQANIFNWGCTCLDLDGDGNVGMTDLILVINNMNSFLGGNYCP